MLDPFTALSVATSAVQFVDFSLKCLSGIAAVYRTIDAKGQPAAFERLEVNAKRLLSSNQRLKASLNPDALGRQPTESEHEVFAVATECMEVAVTLRKALEPLPSSKAGSIDNSVWRKIKISVLAVRNQEKLDALQEKLKDLRGQLTFVILLNLREDMKDFAHQLDAKKSPSDAIWGTSSSIGKQILEQVESMKQWQSNLDLALRDLRKWDYPLDPATHQGDGIQMPSWPDTAVAKSLLDRLLSDLRFSEMSVRRERVAEAHVQTFRWIFGEPQNRRTGSWHSFVKWLETDEPLYWITGKAGSGKSTLMKYMLQDEQTEEHLQVWGNGTPVITASFYFWLAGAQNLQHSQEGFLRALLADALGHLRTIAPKATLARWNSFALSKDTRGSWSWGDLQQAFRFLLEDDEFPVKYCFFIDGLDELKGDLSSLLSFIRKISQYPNVKLCVTSRPWLIFEDEFSSKPQLMLQDLTYPDIKQYLDSELGSSVAFKELQRMDKASAASLVENIAEKSSGVFLWVVLVARSLKEGLRDGDRLPDLQKRLNELPPQLEDLFRTILHNFNGRYMQQASGLFQIVKASPSSLSLLCLSLADEEDPNLAIKAKATPELFFPNQRFYRALNMRRRLDSRCKGLLEAAPIWIKDAELSGNDESSNDESSDDESAPASGGPVILITPPSQAEHPDLDHEKILRDLSRLPPERGDLLANAKVEYLHRTVKDFLDQEQVWTEIKAASAPDFNPPLALARSYLLQLKWVYPNIRDMPKQEVWAAIFKVLEFSAQAQALGATLAELLDELAKTIAPLFTLENNSSSGSGGKPNTPTVVASTTSQLAFLRVIVQWDLHGYLGQKLASLQLCDQDITSLLKSAVSEQHISGEPSFAHPRPYLETVKSLLDHSSLPEEERQSWVQKAERTRSQDPGLAEDTWLKVPTFSAPGDNLSDTWSVGTQDIPTTLQSDESGNQGNEDRSSGFVGYRSPRVSGIRGSVKALLSRLSLKRVKR